MRNLLTAAAMLTLPGWVGSARAEVITSAGSMIIEPVAVGLEEPWAIAFLFDGSFLITERGGKLKWFREVGAQPRLIHGLPEVWVDSQGGLLDVMIPHDFETSREIWLTYAAPVEGGAVLAVGKGVLGLDMTSIRDFKPVFLSPDVSPVGRHFGSRLVEATDGTIFVTSGERGDAATAQAPYSANGKIIHLNRDGSPATFLPLFLPGVYAFGFRNPQGATLDLSGNLLTVEHGPKGGDELNALVLGGNFGWPLTTHGISYDNKKIGVGETAPFMIPPLHYWDPSVAPSGLMVYSGTLVPEWKGDIFYGSLNSDFLGRLDPDTPADNGYAEERISAPETGRVRDVVEAADGSIWILSVLEGAAFRIAPSND